ncbi:MAG: hypothetical protein H7322_17780 [Ramlibacter sp.]|nr:hypothetical protein [Ramlibacter sp.]
MLAAVRISRWRSLAHPGVTLSRGALIGAAIGTTTMPGAGAGPGLAIG